MADLTIATHFDGHIEIIRIYRWCLLLSLYKPPEVTTESLIDLERTEAAAKTMGLPFLGRVPLNLAIRQSSDAGEPSAAGDGPEADIFAGIARQVLAWLDAPQG